MKRKRFKKTLILLISIFVLVILSYVFYEIWVVRVDGPGFRNRIIAGDITRDNAEKTVKFSFLTTGHIRDKAWYYYYQIDVRKMDSNNEIPNMLCSTFLESIDKINKINPDYIFITGDTLSLEYPLNKKRMDVEKESVLFDSCWDQVFSQFERINPEAVFLPGNHDIFNFVGAGVYRDKIGPHFRSLVIKDVRFVLLNSSKIEAEVSEYYAGPEEKWFDPRSIDIDQVDFLKEGFAELWKEEIIFVFIHHDPLATPHWERDVHPILRGTKCKAVFSGTDLGTLRYRIKDGISYIDGGFDYRELVPSYFVLTSVYDNNDIKFSVYPVFPEKLEAKINMALHLVKRVLKRLF